MYKLLAVILHTLGEIFIFRYTLLASVFFHLKFGLLLNSQNLYYVPVIVDCWFKLHDRLFGHGTMGHRINPSW